MNDEPEWDVGPGPRPDDYRWEIDNKPGEPRDPVYWSKAAWIIIAVVILAGWLLLSLLYDRDDFCDRRPPPASCYNPPDPPG